MQYIKILVCYSDIDDTIAIIEQMGSSEMTAKIKENEIQQLIQTIYTNSLILLSLVKEAKNWILEESNVQCQSK